LGCLDYFSTIFFDNADTTYLFQMNSKNNYSFKKWFLYQDSSLLCVRSWWDGKLPSKGRKVYPLRN